MRNRVSRTKQKKAIMRNPRPRSRRIMRNRLMVTFDSGIGEITVAFNFKKQEHVRAAFDALLHSYSVAGMACILNGKFAGARDGLGS